MVQFTSALLLALSAVAMQARGAPLLNKRIAQTIADSTALWEKACVRRSSRQTLMFMRALTYLSYTSSQQAARTSATLSRSPRLRRCSPRLVLVNSRTPRTR